MKMEKNIPAHIPGDLIVDVDFYDLVAEGEDVFYAWERHQKSWKSLRGGTPLVFSPHNGGHWIVTRGKDLEVLYADVENLSNSSIAIPSHEAAGRVVPGESDGEEHAGYRNAVMKAFTPVAVNALREPIRQIAAKLIAEIEPRGSCDFMNDFAYRLPMILFLDMMKLPLEDGDMLLSHAHSVIRGSHEEQVNGIKTMFAYLKSWIARRRAAPGDDLISKMGEAMICGAPITDDGMLSVCTNVLLGGLDTVASMLGFMIRHLAENDDIRARLVENPKQIAASLNELTRRFPIASLGRVVAKDFSYDGIQLKAGDRVLLPTPLHGLDGDMFENPMLLDLDRKVPLVMSFGRGTHQCLGSYVARVELAESLSEWLAKIPNFKIKPNANLEISCGPINAIKYLPLEW